MNIKVHKYVVACILPLAVAFSAPVLSAEKAGASLYERLGGFDAITAVVDDVVQQIAADKKLGRFWEHRGKDGITREKQLIVDFISNQAGGKLYYTGREMKLSHEGMRIDEKDWDILIVALKNTLKKFKVPTKESNEVLAFFDSTKKDIVEKH